MSDEPGQTAAVRLLGDDPIESHDDDALDRGPFADRVVEILDHVAEATPSAVLGLMGPWGSGKTSVLNLLRRKLDGHGDWQVVELNPWMVADLPSLLEEFFVTLLSTLPEDGVSSLRRKVLRYAKAVSPMTSPLKVVGVDLEGPIKAAQALLEGDQSLEARRGELEAALREHGKPILMIADDLDRLQPDELLLVFKLVRLLGRLPNTYYLLAFDERTALDVLGSTDLARRDPERALAYLEKVVQIRLDLPPAHPRQVSRLLDAHLEAMTARHGVVLGEADRHRFSGAYHSHMARHLTGPRQVKRYCAQLEATYPLVKGEVDFVDFAVVTFLRTFHPGVVAVLERHRAELTRSEFRFGRQVSRDELAAVWRSRMEQAAVPSGECESLLGLLGELFLDIKGALEGTEYSGSREGRTAERRIDTPEYFDRYLHLGISDWDVADAAVRRGFDELIEGNPGPAWQKVIEVASVNSDRVLRKLHRLAPQDAASAERLAPHVAALSNHVSDEGFFASGSALVRLWLADIIEAARPADPAAFARAVAEAGGVRLVARASNTLRLRSEEAGNVLTDSALATQAAIVGLVAAELDRQAALPPNETDGVQELLSMRRALDPSADVKGWLTDVVDAGRWPIPDVLGLFVGVGTASSGGPSYPCLSDPSVGFLDEVLGVQFVLDRIAGLPAGDPPNGETDVSFENRVRVMRAALPQVASS